MPLCPHCRPPDTTPPVILIRWTDTVIRVTADTLTVSIEKDIKLNYLSVSVERFRRIQTHTETQTQTPIHRNPDTDT